MALYRDAFDVKYKWYKKTKRDLLPAKPLLFSRIVANKKINL